jgi:hypothetical protein
MIRNTLADGVIMLSPDTFRDGFAGILSNPALLTLCYRGHEISP